MKAPVLARRKLDDRQPIYAANGGGAGWIARRTRFEVCLAIILSADVLVAALWAMVKLEWGLAVIDEPVAHWAATNVGPLAVDVWTVVTAFGSTVVVIVALACLAIADTTINRRVSVLMFVVIVGLGEHLIVTAIKHSVERPRPDMLQHIAVTGSA